MDEQFKNNIDVIAQECLRGARQDRATIIKLLSVDPASEEAAYMRSTARDVALRVSGGCAKVGGCIGLDYAPCKMNCSFCSFAEKLGIVTDAARLSDDQVLAIARDYAETGVNTITLRTTEFYDVNEVCRLVALIRQNVPGAYEICLNVGELSPEAARHAFECGASSAYHVFRLGEGVDTPFDPEVRKQTVRAISASPLKLNTGIEPIGIEHTNEQLADHILFALSCDPESLGIKPRVNVPGTPFEGKAPLSDERIAQIVAVIRLVSGSRVKYVSSHPGEALALSAGGNGSNVERGASPHAASFSEREWRGITPQDNIALLRAAGLSDGLVHPDPRFVDGANWWASGQLPAVENPTFISDDGATMMHGANGGVVPLKLAGADEGEGEGAVAQDAVGVGVAGVADAATAAAAGSAGAAADVATAAAAGVAADAATAAAAGAAAGADDAAHAPGAAAIDPRAAADQHVIAEIDRIANEGLRGAIQNEETILRLLNLSVDSPEVAYMRQVAGDFAMRVAGGHGRVAGAIGLDLHPCKMNCSFCSFGEKWGLVREERILTVDQVVSMARSYVEAGITQVTLRSTEFYDLNEIARMVTRIRAEVPGDYEICLNVGELSAAMAYACWQAGANSAYHVLRMGEGVDTPFDPEVRRRSIDAICASPLKFSSCIEPIGVEHTNEQIAQRMAYVLSREPYAVGIMPRIPVPGTPLGHLPMLGRAVMRQQLAVLRLCAGSHVKYVSMHPDEVLGLELGANCFSVERGAIPRDTEFSEEEWKGLSAAQGLEIVRAAGYRC